MAALLTKGSVKFHAFPPAMMRMLRACYEIAQRLTEVEHLVITSANDGSHSVGSRHYMDEALDIRTHNFPDELSRTGLAQMFKEELGPEFTVLYEGPGTLNAHIHIQPKKGSVYEGPI